ncbi:Ribosomal protein L31e protein [Raphanus sativus]|nr:Ribosomal protein L31e protein [Raphanus sativus]
MALAYDPLFITSDKSPIDITSRTQSENHTTRPNALFNRFVVYCVPTTPPSPTVSLSLGVLGEAKEQRKRHLEMSEKKGRKEEVVTREYTINLHRRLHSCTFKKKAPKAIKVIRKFAEKAMGTKDVRVDLKLNKQIWSRGIRGPPRRIRVRVARKRNDDEDAKEEFFSLVTVAEIPAEGLSGLGTKVIDEED